MITFFANVRPFVEEFDELQREAIASWAYAVPGAQIIVTGDVEGATDLGVEHIPGVEKNALGAELVSDIWRIGIENAEYEWVCALNSDDSVRLDIEVVLGALKRVARPFVIGQRWNCTSEGIELNPIIGGMDWFLFRRDTVPVGEIPPFAVGQGRYDRWLVWAAIEKWDMTVIDATKDIIVSHISHEKIIGPEYQRNTKLFRGSGAYMCNVSHAPFVLSGGKLKRRVE